MTNGRVCKKNAAMSWIVLAVGVTSIVLGLLGAHNTPEEAHTAMRLMGMATGFGTGLLLVAGYFLLRARFAKPETLQKAEIEQNDERNQLVQRSALSIAAVSGVCVLAVLAFVLLALGYSLPSALCIAGMYVETGVYLVAHAVYNRKL